MGLASRVGKQEGGSVLCGDLEISYFRTSVAVAIWGTSRHSTTPEVGGVKGWLWALGQGQVGPPCRGSREVKWRWGREGEFWDAVVRGREGENL